MPFWFNRNTLYEILFFEDSCEYIMLINGERTKNLHSASGNLLIRKRFKMGLTYELLEERRERGVEVSSQVGVEWQLEVSDVHEGVSVEQEGVSVEHEGVSVEQEGVSVEHVGVSVQLECFQCECDDSQVGSSVQEGVHDSVCSSDEQLRSWW